MNKHSFIDSAYLNFYNPAFLVKKLGIFTNFQKLMSYLCAYKGTRASGFSCKS